jgi:hypothetical protein
MQADSLILELPQVALKQRDKLPHLAGIYYVIDENNLVWYIGQAKNLYSRWQGKSHHRLVQLSSQKKKDFRICYQLVTANNLDSLEQREIAKYNPHLNQSPVKRKKVRPTETFLRETLVKLSDYLVILGIEPPRIIDEELCRNCQKYGQEWWVQKQVINLEIIHLGISLEQLNQITDNYEAVEGILNSAFVSRKAYANKWQLPPMIKDTRYLTTRLLVNGYAVEVSALLNSNLSFINDTFYSTLATEDVKALSGKSLMSLQETGIKNYMGLFIGNPNNFDHNHPNRQILKRLKPYQADPIKLVFNEELNYPELRNYITKMKQDYQLGLRGIGSRSRSE